MAVRQRQRWLPTRRLVIFALAFSGLLSSLSLFSSINLSNCAYNNNNKAYPHSTRIQSTALAFSQSHGLFDTIADATWERMQDHARASVKYMYPDEPSKGYRNQKRWYLDNLQPDFTCPHAARVGGHGDGPVWTCDPHRLLERPYCLVYSIVGAAAANTTKTQHWKWYDGLMALQPHCEIHVFDATLTGSSSQAIATIPREGDTNAMHVKRNIHYHAWGLKSSYDAAYNPAAAAVAKNITTAEFLSFPDMVARLGHANRTIDILKIHCDACAWSTYKDWISANVGQLLIETHGVPSPIARNPWHHAPMNVADFFNAFRGNNFAMFSKEVNVQGEGKVMEFGYVKVQPDFWLSKDSKSWFTLLLLFMLTPFGSVTGGGGGISDCLNESFESDMYRDAPWISKAFPALLAYEQSYGFFDSIHDESWKLMQQRARASVQYGNPLQPDLGHENPTLWYMNNLQPDFTCPQVRRIGGHGDGPKWTCDPHRLTTSPYHPYRNNECLIYSVGSEGKYEFEDSLIRELGDTHCEIHVFDPGDYTRPGDPQKNNIHYHQWGLKSSYDEAYNAAITLNALGGAAPDLRSFPETLKLLGHEDRTIDIFKLDCEKCEWANYRDWISHDIRQILIETHGVPSPSVEGNVWHHGALQVAAFFDAFRDNDFAMFSKEVNVHGGGRCIEFSYLKLHPDFWGEDGKHLAETRSEWSLSSFLPSAS